MVVAPDAPLSVTVAPLPPAVGLMVPEMVQVCGATTIVLPRRRQESRCQPRLKTRLPRLKSASKSPAHLGK